MNVFTLTQFGYNSQSRLVSRECRSTATMPDINIHILHCN
jgi:hypothetical protein